MEVLLTQASAQLQGSSATKKNPFASAGRSQLALHGAQRQLFPTCDKHQSHMYVDGFCAAQFHQVCTLLEVLVVESTSRFRRPFPFPLIR